MNALSLSSYYISDLLNSFLYSFQSTHSTRSVRDLRYPMDLTGSRASTSFIPFHKQVIGNSALHRLLSPVPECSPSRSVWATWCHAPNVIHPESQTCRSSDSGTQVGVSSRPPDFLLFLWWWQSGLSLWAMGFLLAYRTLWVLVWRCELQVGKLQIIFVDENFS